MPHFSVLFKYLSELKQTNRIGGGWKWEKNICHLWKTFLRKLQLLYFLFLHDEIQLIGIRRRVRKKYRYLCEWLSLCQGWLKIVQIWQAIFNAIKTVFHSVNGFFPCGVLCRSLTFPSLCLCFEQPRLSISRCFALFTEFSQVFQVWFSFHLHRL